MFDRGEDSRAKGRVMIFAVAAAILCAATAAAPAPQEAKDSPLLQEGDLRYNSADLNGSIDSYTRALLSNPSLAAAYARRGRSYRAKGDLDQALVDLDHAINLLPKDPWSRRERALVFMARQTWEPAIADFDVAVK